MYEALVVQEAAVYEVLHAVRGAEALHEAVCAEAVLLEAVCAEAVLLEAACEEAVRKALVLFRIRPVSVRDDNASAVAAAAGEEEVPACGKAGKE